MTERMEIRPVLSIIMLQIGLFQLALWAHLAGNARMVLVYGGLSAAALLAVGGYYLITLRSSGYHRREERMPLRRESPAGGETDPHDPGDQSRALILGTLGFVVTFMVWGSISPLALQFKAMYDLTNTQVSLLIAVPVILGSVGRLPMGILADRFGPRRVYVGLLLFLLIPLAAMGFTRSFAGLLGVSFFLGLAGSSFAIGIPFVSRWYPASKQGTALGIFGAGNFGQALGVLYAPRVAAALGWPYVYWTLIIPVALTALAIWYLGKEAPRPALSKAQAAESIWTSPQAWLLSLFYFVSFGGFVAFSNYLPKLYQELHTLTAADAGTYTAIFVLVATFARPLGGWVADKISADKVLLTIYAVALGGAVVLSKGPAIGAFTLTVGLLALALGIGNGAVFKLVPTFFPGRTGAVTGMVGAMGGLGGFFPPLVMGMARDQTGSYGLGFIGLAAFAVLCISGVVMLIWSGRREAAAALERA
ncbi:MAG: MFS transporter [Bacillota bacterium]